MVSADQTDGPAPAIAGLSVQTLTPPTAGRLVTAAQMARLNEQYADVASPDARTTVVTFRHNGQNTRRVFVTFSPRAQDSPAAAGRRRLAAAFVTGLSDVDTLAGPDGVSAPAPLRPDRLAISVRPVLGGTAPVKPWTASSVDLAALAETGP